MFRKGLQLLSLLACIAVLASFSFPEAERVPQEAYSEAEHFLHNLEQHFRSYPNDPYIQRAMRLHKIEDLAQARFGTPYNMYGMSSSDLQKTSIKPSAFLDHARFSYYCFPVMIGNECHGRIYVGQVKNQWAGGYLGQDEMLDYICQLMQGDSAQAGNMYSIILIDSQYLYAFTKHSGRYYFKAGNPNSASLFGGETGEVAFTKARGYLLKYAAEPKYPCIQGDRR